MIDIHTHILPDVDDGAENLEIALAIAREAEKQGIKDLVATPHYLEDGYRLSPPEIKERVVKLQRVIEKENIKVKVLPGSEVFISRDLSKRVDDGLITTINDSRYILIEFPLTEIPVFTSNIFYDLMIMGYKPVISHPERYKPVMEDPNYLYSWVKEGVYAQVNASSLLGVFGSGVKKTAEVLVKHNLVQLIGSDVHSTGQRRECLKEGLARVRELVGPSADKYLENGDRLINDRELVFLPPRPYKKKNGFFSRVKHYLQGAGIR